MTYDCELQRTGGGAQREGRRLRQTASRADSSEQKPARWIETRWRRRRSSFDGTAPAPRRSGADASQRRRERHWLKHGSKQRRRWSASSRSSLEAMGERVAVAGLADRIGAAAEKVQREAENAADRRASRRARSAERKTAAKPRDGQLQHESDQVRARLAEIDRDAEDGAPVARSAARDRRGELSATQAKLAVRRAAHGRDLHERTGHRSATSCWPTTTSAGRNRRAARDGRTAYREMRTQLDNMGPVNMMALEEYKETAQRHEFLETQRKDLLDSIENTQNTIKEIDTISRQKFEEAFARDQ